MNIKGVSVFYLQKFPFIASFDWRSDYKERITLEASKRPSIESSHPWYSALGIYHHYSAQVSEVTNSTLAIQFRPRFMFGLPPILMARMFPDAASLPVLGMMTSTVSRDRVIVQTIMTLVASSVVVLLKIKAK